MLSPFSTETARCYDQKMDKIRVEAVVAEENKMPSFFFFFL